MILPPKKVLSKVQLAPQDDVRKEAGEILRRIDQLIKGGQIDQAIREIIHAKEIDPGNLYVRAYEERLAYLKAQHETNVERERTKREAEAAARKRDEELRSQLEEEQRRQKKELAQREEERKKQEERDKTSQEHTRAIEIPQALRAVPANDGADQKYADAFTKAWSTGNITPLRAVGLQKLCSELGISPERKHQIDGQILSDLGSKSDSETILVIDDDEQMLLLISQLLIQHGYQVTSLTSTDEAYALLKKWKPRLILSDINLETSTMGGFSFYEKVRELDHLDDVPFVFLTGMSDEVLVRTGKELGVDDYLTKPFSEQDLLGTVKGKLKRFGKLGERAQKGL
ncbi:MAG: response regulator [Bacteroidota bacterium]